MNALLLTVAVVSTGAAVVLGLMLLRLRREARERSEARVAALAGAIDAFDDVRPAPVDWVPEGAPTLFAPERPARSAGVPVIRVAVAAMMAVALLIVIAMANRGPSAADQTDRGAVRAASRAAAPLELVSMRHERSGGELKVSGLVRNPRSGATLTRITAVVFAFNRSGAFIASGRAGVDFTTLEPGDESPFVVMVPGAGDVGRYRVSFRTDAGVVQHVDRRGEQMRAVAVLE
jgi:hypothetical protein